MGNGTKNRRPGSSLCASDCCFIDLEITSCTKSFFGWGGAEEHGDAIVCHNSRKDSRKDSKVYPLSQHRRKQHRDCPPPVIALSHSTASNSSSDVSSQFNDSTEERRPISTRVGVRNRDCIRNQVLRRNSNVGYNDICPPILPRKSIRDYAANHEMLINCLFDDAQARHAIKIGNASTTKEVPPPEVSPQKSIYPKPTMGLRKTSAASATSSRTSRSRNSIHSKSSCHSEILTPSSHQFKPTLTKKRRKVYALPIFCLRIRKRKKSKTTSTCSHTSGTPPRISAHSPIPPPPENPPTPTPEESSCASSNYTDTAISFLHMNCRLQKDKGKGVAPGNAIVARGRHDAMKKLGEKIDLLVEVTQNGNWSKAAITRVPARIMARDPKKSEENDIIETRSMIGVKMGLASMRYGILIHWNKALGQAELVLLRKMCSSNFLKDRNLGKEKSPKKWMKGAGLVRKMSSTDLDNELRELGTPSFVTVNSNDLSIEGNSSWTTLKY